MVIHRNRLLCCMTVAVLCLLLTACGLGDALSSEARLAETTEAYVGVVQPEDLEKLNSYTALKTADFSGSDCYDEMLAWTKAHPDVAVTYTVALPDGTTPDNSTASLDLSDLTAEQINETLELVEYLPALKSVDLGSTKLKGDEYGAMRAKYPDIDFKCQFTVDGKPVDLTLTELDLTGVSSEIAQEYIAVMPMMTKLTSVELGSDEDSLITWEDIAAIQKACPNAHVNYAFKLYNKKFTLDSTKMILSHKTIEDNGALVKRVLACMPQMAYLDMDTCGVSNEDMAAIRDAFPNIKVVWRVWFGERYSVRTDVEKILASCTYAFIDDSNSADLKYCTDVKYLDLGHNIWMKDLSFLSYMPKLEVAILAMNSAVDFSPLADCPEIEFLELGASGLDDLSCLSNAKKLRHLSFPNCPCLFDLSPIYGLTELERLWIGPYTPISAEQVAEYQKIAPDCQINTWSEFNGSCEPGKPGWRFIGYGPYGAIRDPRYILLYEQFDYGNQYSWAFSGNDPLYYGTSEPY